MFILDTNVVSELRKIGSGRADLQVARWAESVSIDIMHLSAMTVLELETGVLQLERKDPRQATMLRRWLDTVVLQEFGSRILPVDTIIAQRCARLHVPDPRPRRDALIAATALVHGLTVVTRNVQDFEGTEVIVLNPWLPH